MPLTENFRALAPSILIESELDVCVPTKPATTIGSPSIKVTVGLKVIVTVLTPPTAVELVSIFFFLQVGCAPRMAGLPPSISESRDCAGIMRPVAEAVGTTASWALALLVTDTVITQSEVYGIVAPLLTVSVRVPELCTQTPLE
jgi:hypothetical protein